MVQLPRPADADEAPVAAVAPGDETGAESPRGVA